MADKNRKWPENVPGKYYVDEECIDCGACNAEDPDHYARNDDAGHNYVHKQPSTPEEEAKAQAGLQSCPVSAIGDDGA